MSPTFAELGVPADLAALLARRGMAAPFPIQAAALPDALAGRDVCGRAPTGSGKTLAFGLALALRTEAGRPRHPAGLVLVPTRELATQVAREIEPLAATRGRKVVAVYGGAGYEPQRKAVARGADIVVATPGRLEDLIAQRDLVLDEVGIVVLDEADRMADMGFLPVVRRILDATTPNRQTLLFSATLDGAVDVLVRRYQTDPGRHDVVPVDDGLEVEHLFWKTERERRVQLTAHLVQRHDRAIVFCRTKRGADRVARQLVGAGVGAVAIHGDRSQGQRERALESFRSGSAQALIATDVAARGIHVDAVPCVVHFDPPADHKDYLHRSGRTGRAGLAGTVVTLVVDDVRDQVRDLQKTLGFTQRVDHPDDEAARFQPSPRDPAARSTDGGGAGAGQRAGGGQRTGGGQRRSRPTSRGQDADGSANSPGGGQGQARSRGSATADGPRSGAPGAGAPGGGGRPGRKRNAGPAPASGPKRTGRPGGPGGRGNGSRRPQRAG